MTTHAHAHAHAHAHTTPRSRLKKPTTPAHTHVYPRAQQAAAIDLRLRGLHPRDIWHQTGVPPAAQKAILLHYLVKKRERAERGYRRLRVLFKKMVRGGGSW
ncbi:uncharacterized protein H6S33_009721 [Morchella sextelata]|uniref:uncharacterized protein n=1 Tax=Morchella sextelata TaxID=1174677 RepID=UPI001D03ACE2|nr:uncharacterized protein H6S33_009721 [Morchella sextelata]KAH0613341.1 hypothetical protein H6S33_009721 [Morchella sextelata]